MSYSVIDGLVIYKLNWCDGYRCLHGRAPQYLTDHHSHPS